MMTKASLCWTALAIAAIAAYAVWLVVARAEPATGAPVVAPAQAGASRIAVPAPAATAQWLAPVAAPTQPETTLPAPLPGDRPPQQSFPRYPRHSGR